jgi:AraC family transcriptional regulator
MSRIQSVENGRFYGGVLSATRSRGLSLAETTYAPGFEVPLHEHATPFICVAVDGSFREEYERRSWELSAGSMFYHPGPGAHAERFGRRGGRCFVAQMGGEWLDGVGARGLRAPERFIPGIGDRSASLALQASRAFRSADTASELDVEGVLVELLAELMRAHRPPERRTPRWLVRATEMVHARYLEPIALSDLAAEVDVHPSHLARSFSRFNGCSVGELVRRLRLEHARSLLEGSERGLSDVALTAGFADQSHLSRSFKRRFGVTPGEYRRSQGRRPR